MHCLLHFSSGEESSTHKRPKGAISCAAARGRGQPWTPGRRLMKRDFSLRSYIQRSVPQTPHCIWCRNDNVVFLGICWKVSTGRRCKSYLLYLYVITEHNIKSTRREANITSTELILCSSPHHSASKYFLVFWNHEVYLESFLKLELCSSWCYGECSDSLTFL